MELSELTAYAEEKYRIREEHKWADFPGFSVLNHPQTGKWVALLMRQWDMETGTELERCDLKCGIRTLAECRAPYLAPPIRMKGPKWISVAFADDTDPELVFRLFDRAMVSGDITLRRFLRTGRTKRYADMAPAVTPRLRAMEAT